MAGGSPSVTSSGVVADAAQSTAALASTLYGLVANIRDDPPAPPSTKHVAGGVRDLSNRLRELRNMLQKVDDRGVFRSGLFARVDSLSGQIQALLADIRGFVIEPGHGGDAGGKPWCALALRKTRADGILVRIDCLKLAVELTLSMMALVWEQDMQTIWKHENDHLNEEDERIFLRTQAETLIQAIKQSIKDASSPTSTTRDVGAQADELDRPSPFATIPMDTFPAASAGASQTPAPVPAEASSGVQDCSTAIERVGHASAQEDTARWLYRFVFGDVASPGLNRTDSDLQVKYSPVAILVSETSKIPETDVMDMLLRAWSRLNEDEIKELRNLSSSSSSSSSSSPSSNDESSAAWGQGISLTRAGVQQMVSKALSYAQHSTVQERARNEDRPDTRSPSGGRRQTSSLDDSSDLTVTRISAHPNKVGLEEIRKYDGRPGETQQDSTSDDRPPPPPQYDHTTSRHRSRPASWVLGSRRAQSRSAERRGAASASVTESASTSARPSSSRSRFIGWRSQQARVKSLDASSSVSLSSASSSSDKRAYQEQQQPPRVSQRNPPQKVLFTSPVARLASSSTTTGTATTTTTTTTTTGRLSTTSKPPSPLSQPSPSSPTSRPTRGILKPPTHHFPEELNPVREGVAPHKSDKTKKDAPQGAKWTKIKRSWVNPEALTVGKERFEVLGDHHVKVLRVLSREEIEVYRIATAQLRAMRQSGGEKEEEQKEAKADEETGQTRTARRSGSASSRDGEGRRESSGSVVSRYAVQGSRTVRKRLPSPRRRRDSGDVPWVLVARSGST